MVNTDAKIEKLENILEGAYWSRALITLNTVPSLVLGVDWSFGTHQCRNRGQIIRRSGWSQDEIRRS